MIKIIKGINSSKVVTDDAKVLIELDELFAFKVPGCEFVDAYKRKLWDGKSHMFSRLTGKFNTGLLPRVVDEIYKLTSTMPTIETTYDLLISKKPIIDKLNGIELRQYQTEAADAFMRPGRGIVKAATNSGKTEIMAELLRRINRPSIVLLHRQEIMYQTAERLEERLSVPVGIIGDNNSNIKDITVVMFQSITERKAVKNTFGQTKKSKAWRMKDEYKHLCDQPVLFFDECHNISDDRAKIVAKESKAIFRGAFSGTPLLHDEITNLTLEGLFGGVVYEISNKELIALGVSSIPVCHIMKIDTKGILSADYAKAYDKGVVYSSTRNGAIREIAVNHANEGKSVLIIAREHNHIMNLMELIPGAEYVHGAMPSKTRRARLLAFKQGKIKTLISSTILDEGVDISNIEVLILAAGGKSSIKILQRIGRGLRANESMQLAVYDFMDIGNWYLLDHSQQRIQMLKSEGFRVKLG